MHVVVLHDICLRRTLIIFMSGTVRARYYYNIKCRLYHKPIFIMSAGGLQR